MAVVGTAQEQPDSPDGDFALGKFVLKRRFRVVCSSINDGPVTVVGAPGIPLMFSTYVTPNESFAFARVKRITPRRIGPKQLVWTVEVVYETPEMISSSSSGGGTGKDTATSYTDPTTELPTAKTHTESHREPITQNYNVATGLLQPVQSSALEVYDPPPERDRSKFTLTITRNEDIGAPHPARSLQYADVVNSDVFWGAAPGQAKIVSIEPETQTKQSPSGQPVTFLRVAYTIAMLPDWDKQLLDYGTRYNADIIRNGVTQGNPQAALTRPPIWTSFTDSRGQPRTGLLDGHGMPLPDQGVVTVSAASNFQLVVTATRKDQFVYFVPGLAVQFANLNGGSTFGPRQNTNYYVLTSSYTVYVPPVPALLGIPATPARMQACTFQLSTPVGPSAQMCTVMTASAVVNGLVTASLVLGSAVTGPGVPANTTIAAINSGTQITLSNTVTAPGTFTTQATTTNLSFALTNIANTAILVVGTGVSGPGIPNNTTILSIDSGTQITMSAAATASASVAVTFAVITRSVTLTFQTTGSAIVFGGGSGVTTIIPQPVYAALRPYNRVPFGPLNLPQSFAECQ